MNMPIELYYLIGTQTWRTYQPTNNCYSRLNAVWITWLWLDGDDSRARALLHRLKLGFVKMYLSVVYLFAFSIFLDTVSCFGGSRMTRMWPQPPISIYGGLFAFVVVGTVLSLQSFFSDRHTFEITNLNVFLKKKMVFVYLVFVFICVWIKLTLNFCVYVFCDNYEINKLWWYIFFHSFVWFLDMINSLVSTY